jgi:type II secretory pathway pseudopilin PulG
MSAPEGRGQLGTTLIELLFAIVIFALCGVAILGSLTNIVMASDVHRKQTQAAVVIRDFAEAVTAEPYRTCASTASNNYSGLPYKAPTGYTAAVAGVQFVSGTNKVSSCPTTDPGAQVLTLTVTTADGRGDETLELVKRRP